MQRIVVLLKSFVKTAEGAGNITALTLNAEIDASQIKIKEAPKKMGGMTLVSLVSFVLLILTFTNQVKSQKNRAKKKNQLILKSSSY